MHTNILHTHTFLNMHTYTQLQNADLSRACLRSAQVDNTIFTGADLSDCILEGCDFGVAHKDFSKVNLSGTTLSNVTMEDFIFSFAVLERVDLTLATVTDCDFSEVCSVCVLRVCLCVCVVLCVCMCMYVLRVWYTCRHTNVHTDQHV
jgi:uncharacterized protein YjbI with pentapeptide repeats